MGTARAAHGMTGETARLLKKRTTGRRNVDRPSVQAHALVVVPPMVVVRPVPMMAPLVAVMPPAIVARRAVVAVPPDHGTMPVMAVIVAMAAVVIADILRQTSSGFRGLWHRDRRCLRRYRATKQRNRTTNYCSQKSSFHSSLL